jgi:hypothetical protein
MTTFFLDLWHDLREKRLWPVAVGLLAAAVAIPAIMLKPAAEPTPPSTIAATGDKAETLPAVSVDSLPTNGSKLETFDERNPFKPLKDLQHEPGTDAPSSGGSSGQGGAGGSTPTGTGSDTGGSPTGGPTGGSPGGGDIPPATSPQPTTDGSGGMHWFKFTADLEFGRSGDAKLRKRVDPLTLLPNDTAPVLVFMGVTADAKGAKFFLVDQGFTADGEGDCNEKGSCMFITLHLDDAHNEETFTSRDGSVAYDLKLVKLHQEEVSEAEARGDADKPHMPKAKRTVSAAGAAETSIADAGREFLPWLIAGPESSADEQK